MMKIMKLRREEKRKMVSGVVIHHLQTDHTEPKPHERHWTSHQQNTISDGHLSSEYVFNGMRINSCRSNWSSPLMVNLMNMFVNQSMMKESVTIVEPRVMAKHANQTCPRHVKMS